MMGLIPETADLEKDVPQSSPVTFYTFRVETPCTTICIIVVMSAASFRLELSKGIVLKAASLCLGTCRVILLILVCRALSLVPLR